jgi:hypothetical protein
MNDYLMFFNRQAVSEGGIKLQTVQQLIKYFYPPPVLTFELDKQMFFKFTIPMFSYYIKSGSWNL